MEVVNFKAEHLNYIKETGMVDIKLRPWVLPEKSAAIEKLGGAFTVLDEGAPVLVGGVVEYWKNRGEAWLIFGQPKTEKFVTLFKMVKRYLELSPLRRIEMVIDYDFKEGHRWAKLLGFKKEAEKLEKYQIHGGDVSLYARVLA